jgi:hypothetical protein
LRMRSTYSAARRYDSVGNIYLSESRVRRVTRLRRTT